MLKSNIDISLICNIATNQKQVENIFEFSKQKKSNRILLFANIHPYKENMEMV